jgi:DNA-binding LacI/PurR family transcriptional regulator
VPSADVDSADVDSADVDGADVDGAAGIRALLDHLHDHGRRRIALVGGPRRLPPWRPDRPGAAAPGPGRQVPGCGGGYLFVVAYL